MKAQRAKMKANEGPKGQNKRKWNQPQPETLEHVVALWLRKQKLRKQGRGSSGKGYMWKVCRGRWRCGRGSTAEAVAEAMNNFLSTRKEKKTNSSDSDDEGVGKMWKRWEKLFPTKKEVLTYKFFMLLLGIRGSYKKDVRSYHRHFWTPSKDKASRTGSFCRGLLLVGNRLL